MRKVCLFYFVLISVVIVNFAPIVNAMPVDFETGVVSEEEKTEIIEEIKLQLLSDINGVSAIRGFDVHTNGNYALAFKENGRSNVYVYDADGVFLYGYTFRSSGDYAIQFREDLLEIYFVRGDVIAVYDPAGNCVDVQNVISTGENHTNARELLDRTDKAVDGKTYRLERNWDFGDSYSRFVAVDEYGERTVLLDVSAENGIRQVALVFYPVIIFVAVIYGAYRKYRMEQMLCD